MSSLTKVHRRKHKPAGDKSRTEESQKNVTDNSKRHEDSSKSGQSDGASSRDAWKEDLFQHFCHVLQRAWDREGPSDCIIISLDKERKYVTSVGHRLRDYGLVVEIIHLTSVSCISRALKEVKDDSSPFCIIIEGSDIRRSTCTVILLCETFKIHSHMHLEDALALVAKKFKSFFAERRAGISQKAAEMVDDFLARKCLSSASLPAGMQHLLFLLSEGKHLSGDELSRVIDYLKTRKEQLEGCEDPGPSTSSPSASLQGETSLLVGMAPPPLPATPFPAPPPLPATPLPEPPPLPASPLPAPPPLPASPLPAPPPLPASPLPAPPPLPASPLPAPPPLPASPLPAPPPLPASTPFLSPPPAGSAPAPLSGNGQGKGLLPLPGLFDPLNLFPLPVLQASTSTKSTPLSRPPAKRKGPLLGEKPGLLGPPPVLMQVMQPGGQFYPCLRK